MSCKDRKCACPATEPGYCDAIDAMAWPEMCAKCRQQPDRIRKRIDNARQNKAEPKDSGPDKMQQAAIMHYCGSVCGGLRNRAINCPVYGKPCQIRNGSWQTCPNGHWTIAGSEFKILKQE